MESEEDESEDDARGDSRGSSAFRFRSAAESFAPPVQQPLRCHMLFSSPLCMEKPLVVRIPLQHLQLGNLIVKEVQEQTCVLVCPSIAISIDGIH